MNIKKYIASFFYPVNEVEDRIKKLETELKNSKFINEYTIKKRNIDTKIIEDQEKAIKTLEDILGKNTTLATQAQTLYVTDHAVDRYVERFKSKEDKECIRKKIYKLVCRHFQTLDKLDDGRYDLDKNIVAKIKDNTVVTVIPRGRR